MAMNTNTANIYIKATDNTKTAFDTISGRLKGLATIATGAVAGFALVSKAAQTVSESFQKFADLNDIADNFDVSVEKALGFTDAMTLVGMSAEDTKKSFSDLSTNITKAFTDEKLKATFNQLGVTLKDLRTGNVGDIFEKILNSTSKTADKAKQLTLLKDVFGKQGLKVLDASQDERVKAILNNANQLKETIRATAFVTDEFDKSLKVAGNTIKNDIAMGFAPALPAINGFIQALFTTNEELDKSQQLLDFIDKAHTFKLLIDGAYDFADVVTAAFVKLGEIVGGFISLLGGGLLKVIPAVNLIGDAIFGAIVGAIKGGISSLGDLATALMKVVKGDFAGAKESASKAFDFSEGFEKYKQKLKEDQAQIDFSNIIIDESWNTITAKLKTGRYDKEKAQFAKAFYAQIQGVIDAVGKDGKGVDGTRMGFDPVNASAMAGAFVKELENQLKLGKDNIDYLQKYNESQYNAQLKDVEEYYQNKRDLMETDYQFQLDMVDKQIALLQKAIPAAGKQEDKAKLEQQANDLLVKRNKIEKDYQLGVLDFNAKEIKDKIQLQELINSRYDTEIEKINIKKELIGLTTQDEANIVKLQNLKIANYQKEIGYLLKNKDITKLTEQDQKTLADLELNIAKTRNAITSDQYKKKLEDLSVSSQLKDVEIERIQFLVENGATLFDNNLSIKKIKEDQVKLLKEEISILEKKENKDKKDILLIEQKKLELEKLKRTTDQVALDINNAVGKGFENFFGDVLNGTKSVEDAFKDMAGNIVSTINSMIAQDLGKELYRSIFPDNRSEGGLGGFVSNLFGTGQTGGGLFDKIGGFISGFFADGGYARAGNAYVVGERGPELFYPGQSGYVMSNKDSSKMVGGNNTVNVTIQTKDYQSFRNSETQVAQQLQRALTRGSRNN